MKRFKLVRVNQAFLSQVGGRPSDVWVIRDSNTGREMRVGCRRIGRDILRTLKLAVRSGLLSSFTR